MNQNSQLTVFLESLREDLRGAASEGDLLEMCKKVRRFTAEGGALHYNLTGYYLVILGSVVLGGAFGYTYFTNLQLFEMLGWYGCLILGFFAFIAIIAGAYAASLGGSVEEISAAMFFKDVQFDNSITEVALSGNEYDEFKEQFGDFNRGDEDQKITNILNIVFQQEGKTRTCRYYTFSYVVVTYVLTPVPNGKGGVTMVTRRVETTYYRYGIILDFPWVNNIAIGGGFDYGATYETGSATFNRLYSVSAESEHIAAKFLKPAVVLALEEISEHLGNMTFEVNGTRKLCLSFSNDDLIDVQRKYLLTEIDEFEEQLAAKNIPEKLKHAMKLVDRLEKHNDKNFSSIS